MIAISTKNNVEMVCDIGSTMRQQAGSAKMLCWLSILHLKKPPDTRSCVRTYWLWKTPDQ
jgi:hypothetical protein